MADVMAIALPIFLIITLGYASGMLGIFGKTAANEINNYIVYIGLPALLFLLIVEAEFSPSKHLGFLILFSISTTIVFLAFLFYRTKAGDGAIKSTLEAFSASYSNTGFMGIPLCLLLFGDAGAIFAIIATVITACIFLLICMIIIEVCNAEKLRTGNILTAALKVIKNPIVISPAAAILFSYSGLDLGDPYRYVLKMLGDASIVFALISIGLFLHTSRGQQSTQSLDMVLAKIIIHPLLTAGIGLYFFNLPSTTVVIAVLLSMLPIGTGPYMVGILYGESLLRISRGILLSTIASFFTITILLWVYFHLNTVG